MKKNPGSRSEISRAREMGCSILQQAPSIRQRGVGRIASEWRGLKPLSERRALFALFSFWYHCLNAVNAVFMVVIQKVKYYSEARHRRLENPSGANPPN